TLRCRKVCLTDEGRILRPVIAVLRKSRETCFHVSVTPRRATNKCALFRFQRSKGPLRPKKGRYSLTRRKACQQAIEEIFRRRDTGPGGLIHPGRGTGRRLPKNLVPESKARAGAPVSNTRPNIDGPQRGVKVGLGQNHRFAKRWQGNTRQRLTWNPHRGAR